MAGIVVGKLAPNAKVAGAGPVLEVRRRANQPAALDVKELTAADAAMGAGRGHAVLRNPPKGDVSLHQGARRADNRARAAENARRFGQMMVEVDANARCR